ncbi:MAG TPA: hypothetical protein PKH02_04850 [Bacteroidales bacterium]|nr:hypothetical protein [Bacteroidales bacterium]HPT11683.1 hypothetical protein [Bacteroidales bacterium]
MRKFYFTIAIVVSCLVMPARIQGQSAATNLDQMKLMKQFLGEWQSDLAKDTLLVFEIKQVGDVFVETDYLVVKDIKSVLSFWNYCYNPEDRKFRIFALNTKGIYNTYIASFISEKEWVQVMVQDFAADKVLRKDMFVFTSPTEVLTSTYTADGIKKGEGKFTRKK